MTTDHQPHCRRSNSLLLLSGRPCARSPSSSSSRTASRQATSDGCRAPSCSKNSATTSSCARSRRSTVASCRWPRASGSRPSTPVRSRFTSRRARGRTGGGSASSGSASTTSTEPIAGRDGGAKPRTRPSTITRACIPPIHKHSRSQRRRAAQHVAPASSRQLGSTGFEHPATAHSRCRPRWCRFTGRRAP